jgi:hypothetical protein
MKLWKRDALAAIEAALDSGKLSNADKASLAFACIEAGRTSRLSSLVDGIDTVELHMFAEEKKMPVSTVSDVVSLLKPVMKSE